MQRDERSASRPRDASALPPAGYLPRPGG
jgi:hypothetical protein